MNAMEMKLAQELQSLLSSQAQLRQAAQNSSAPTLSAMPAASVAPVTGNLEAVSGVMTPASPSPVADALTRFLPKELRPSNVGKVSELAWPYIFPINFALGVNPTISSTTTLTQIIQVPKDAGFLLLGLSLSADDATQAGVGAPLQLLIKDNQSAQQFNDNPIALQNLPFRGRRRPFPVVMYFAPSATVSLTLSSWLSAGSSVTPTSTGNIQISLHGLLTGNVGNSDTLSKAYAEWMQGASS